MNFITIVEFISVDSIINNEPMFDEVINNHYHKARILQRCLTGLTNEQQQKFSNCGCYLENNALILTAEVFSGDGIHNIVDVIEEYQEEGFEVSCQLNDNTLTVTIKQTFEGREDEVIYGD